MATSLYTNPALTPSALSEQGQVAPNDPTTAETMDSVFFNIENNTFRTLYSNYKGNVMDEEADTLLNPEDVWERFGVKTEAPISEGNALRMRDNMDEVARKNFNVNTLEHTSANQIRLMANSMGGSVLTDPAQIALAAVGGTIFMTGAKLLSKVGAINKVAKTVNATRIGRVGTAALTGASTGYMEGVMESEILLDQAPKAGLKFTDEDYDTNVKMNTVFGGLLGGLSKTGKEGWDAWNTRRVTDTYNEFAAGKAPYTTDVTIHQPKGYTGPNTSGTFYNAHYTKGEAPSFDFSSQSSFSNTDFGDGYSFSPNRDRAFYEDGTRAGFKKDVFKAEFKNVKLNLYNTANPLTPTAKTTFLRDIEGIDGFLTDLPTPIQDIIKKGEVPVWQIAELLSSFDAAKGTKHIEILNNTIRSEGFDGYSFGEGDASGMHLFKMPEGMAVDHLTPTQKGAREDFHINKPEPQPDYTKKAVGDKQKQLEYYSDRASDLNHDVKLEAELKTIPMGFVAEMGYYDPVHDLDIEFARLKLQSDQLESEMIAFGIIDTEMRDMVNTADKLDRDLKASGIDQIDEKEFLEYTQNLNDEAITRLMAARKVSNSVIEKLNSMDIREVAKAAAFCVRK